MTLMMSLWCLRENEERCTNDVESVVSAEHRRPVLEFHVKAGS